MTEGMTQADRALMNSIRSNRRLALVGLTVVALLLGGAVVYMVRAEDQAERRDDNRAADVAQAAEEERALIIDLQSCVADLVLLPRIELDPLRLLRTSSSIEEVCEEARRLVTDLYPPPPPEVAGGTDDTGETPVPSESPDEGPSGATEGEDGPGAPQGPPGEQGPAGPPGEDGENDAPIVVPGIEICPPIIGCL